MLSGRAEREDSAEGRTLDRNQEAIDLLSEYKVCPSDENLVKILDHFMPMVRRLARTLSKGSRSRVVDREDLISAGVMGVTEAVQSYDSDRGNFSSFCFMKARWSITDELRKSGMVSSYMHHQGVRRESISDNEASAHDDHSDLRFFDMIDRCREAPGPTGLTLSDQELCVIVCRYQHGLNLGDISKILGISSHRLTKIHEAALDIIRDGTDD